MPDVYLVMGVTGEYSDQTSWAVAAYLDEAKAQTHVELASARARELGDWKDAEGRAWNDYRVEDFPGRPVNEYDLDMRMDDMWTTYHIEVAPLLDAIPGVAIEAPLTDPEPNTAKPLWERLDEED